MARALILLLSLYALGARADTGGLVAGVFSPPRLAPEFTLRGSDGADLNLGHYRGKVVLLAFGYTSCTEVCPVTLSILAQARRKLGAAASELQVVYITVDPARDTALRMRSYLTAFDPSFVGGTGTEAQLAAVRAAYGISLGPKVAVPGGYVLSHSSFTYLIDRSGKLHALMPFGHSAEDFAHDVRLLLKQ
jgi:protein SCO1/2